MKWINRLVLLVLALALAGAIAGFVIHEARPVGTPGAEADALARKVQEAVGTKNWSAVGAIQFEYAGRHTILWDRQRSLARVAFDDAVVWVNVAQLAGVAERAGVEVTDSGEKQALVDEAYGWFINDTFWLDPFTSLFDEGVQRAIAKDDEGRTGLLVTYGSGGLTPGDAYLWFAGPDGVPTSWKFWVSVLPLGGLETSWEEWVELAGGAKVATRHRSIIDFGVTNLEAKATLGELVPGPDPFARIAGGG